MGERTDRLRKVERPAWMSEGRWWNSGWISLAGLVVFWIPLLIVVVFASDQPAFALLFPGAFIYISAFNIYRAWKRRRAGGRF